MGSAIFVGGFIGLLLWLASRNAGAAEPVVKTVDPPPVPVSKKACKDCMCPDATITLQQAQAALIKLKILPATTASGKPGADGVCGTMTTTAIRNFQASRKLVVSGFVDAPTSAALLQEANAPTPDPKSTTDSSAGNTYEEDYTDGCNAGSKDASASIDAYWDNWTYGNPLADVYVKRDNYDSVSDAWDDGYRDCFDSSLTQSGFSIDEDGVMSVTSLTENPLTNEKVTIIGDTLPSSGSGGQQTRVAGLRKDAILRRAARR